MAEQNQIVELSINNVKNTEKLEDLVKKEVRSCVTTKDDVLMLSRQVLPLHSMPRRLLGQYMISCPNQLLQSLCIEMVAEEQCTLSAIGQRKAKRPK